MTQYTTIKDWPRVSNEEEKETKDPGRKRSPSILYFLPTGTAYETSGRKHLTYNQKQA